MSTFSTLLGLEKSPFSLNSDASDFIQLPSHTRALAQLIEAIEVGELFVTVIGDVGTGKTLLARKLVQHFTQLDEYHTVLIGNPVLSPVGLLRQFGRKLGLRLEDRASYENWYEDIERVLLRTRKKVVLIIDEAQALPNDTLESLRLLTNFGVDQDSLQIVLFAQNELDELLKEHHFRQLQQRISRRVSLEALDLESSQRYIHYRLKHGGYTGPELFSRQQIQQLYRLSQGVPRVINLLCHQLLLILERSQSSSISKRQINDVARSLGLSERKGRLALGITLGLILLNGFMLWANIAEDLI